MLYNTFIIINNNWKRAMESSDNDQKKVIIDEQGAKDLQQVKDDNKTTGITETLANGDNQKVSEEQKTKENTQGIDADDKIEVKLEDKKEPERETESISTIQHRKSIETNLAKVMGAQAVVMGANALVGLSNPIGLMICVAIAFKKLTASTKDIEFKQDAGKIKKIGSKADKIVVDILDDDNDIEKTTGKSNPAVLNVDKNKLEIDKKTLDEIGKLFSKEEQERCAETGKVEISEDKAKKLSKIFNCNVKAGTLDFNDEKSLNNLLGNENPKIIEELKSALNPKINEKIQQAPVSVRKVVVGEKGV